MLWRMPCGPVSRVAAGLAQPLVHDAARRARVQAAAADAEEQGGPAGRGGEPGAARVQPAGYRAECGHADRHGAFLVALAPDPDGAAALVEVARVQPAQLADPDPGRVEQLEHGGVAEGHGGLGVGWLGRWPGRAGLAGRSAARCGGSPGPARGLVQAGQHVGHLLLGSTCGRVRRVFSVPSCGPGSVASQPRRWAKAVKARAAAPRRASVARAAPDSCWIASQPRSSATPSCSGVPMPWIAGVARAARRCRRRRRGRCAATASARIGGGARRRPAHAASAGGNGPGGRAAPSASFMSFSVHRRSPAERERAGDTLIASNFAYRHADRTEV